MSLVILLFFLQK